MSKVFIRSRGCRDKMRTCVICDSNMHVGFLNEGNDNTYCSKKCLHEHMSETEYQEAYEEGMAFWTTWDD